MWQLGPLRALFKELSKVYPDGESPYHEGWRTVLVCNAPWITRLVWQAATPIVPTRALSKVRIVESCAQELAEHIDLAQIPHWLGGDAPADAWTYGITDARETTPPRAKVIRWWRPWRWGRGGAGGAWRQATT